MNIIESTASISINSKLALTNNLAPLRNKLVLFISPLVFDMATICFI